MEPFASYLANNLVLLDGAMGTLIYERGIFIDKCYDALNLTNPELIRSIHQEYIEAGARVVETNTFGANRFKLAKHNLTGQEEAINREGVRLAREAAEDRAYVAGSMGPLGVRLEPWGETALSEAFDAFREQAQALAAEGVDLFILETFSDHREILEGIRAVKEAADVPVIAMMAIQEDGETLYGLPVVEVAEALTESGADVIGINCAVGPKSMLDFMECALGVTDKPVAIMPNAGRPQMVDGRTLYMTTPDYFGVYARRFIDHGARVLGGCCGTTPEHIRKMAGALAQKQTRLKIEPQAQAPVKEERRLPDPMPARERSRLARKMLDGEAVVLVEIVPPRGPDISRQLAGVQKLKRGGVDAVNIPDGPRASARMNGLGMAVKLQEELGVETVLHYTCRDRNLLGMQSDLLSASLLGIHNILSITGDPPMMGDYPQATPVFDIDSIGLTNIITQLNRGLDIGGKPFGKPTAFFNGVGVDPNAVNLERELERFQWKVDAGADFAVTQPVFDPEALEVFLEKMGSIRLPIIAGIWPLVSYRNAEFMRNEVPGVTVPDAVMKRMAAFESKEDQLKAGIEIAREMVRRVRVFTAGIQASAPFGKVDVALNVAESLLKSA